MLKGRYFDVAHEEYLREEVRTQRDILRARRQMYTRAQKAIDPAGRIVAGLTLATRKLSLCTCSLSGARRCSPARTAGATKIVVQSGGSAG